jgi:hypothetical protein
MKLPKNPATALLILVAIAYIKSLPSTVQTLDTGELVASAYRLHVAHPPGFPVFVWLQFLATHLIPFGTVFWKASFATAVFSLAALALFAYARKSALFFFACVLPLAFSRVYWEYSLLPDVFMLNVLLMAGIGAAYLRLAPSRLRTVLVFVLFALGCANHPITIFMAPILIDCLIEDRAIRWDAIAAAVFTGFIAYASLLVMHPMSLSSWGELRGLGDVLRHAVRSDYGSFQLSGHSDQAQTGSNLLLFFQSLAQSVPLALLACVAGALRPSRKFKVFLAVAVLYFITFCFLANASEAVILDRFFLFGSIFVILAAIEPVTLLENKLNPGMRAGLCAVGVAIAILNLSLYRGENNYSSNTIVDDYARNLLKMAEGPRPTVFIVDGDTRCASIHYLQDVEGLNPQDLVFCLGIIFDVHQLNKLAAARPELVILPDWEKTRDVLTHIVRPNLAKFDFILTPHVDSKAFHVTYLGLGRKLTDGSGEEVDLASLKKTERRSDPMTLDLPTGFIEYKQLYAEYAFPYLKAGLLARTPDQAMSYFKEALELVPYCAPALGNICSLLKKSGQPSTECEAQLSTLRANELNYF